MTLNSLALLVAIASADTQPRATEAALPGANGKIAFVRTLGPQGDSEIFVMDADGSNQTQISNHPGSDEHPTWSPDGSKIAFQRRPAGGGRADIWVMNADGNAQTNLTNTPMGDEITPTWSPDGTRIAFSDFFSGSGIKILRVLDQTVTDLGVRGVSPAWSPDGGRILFIGWSDLAGSPHIYVMNKDGSNPVNIGYPGTNQIGSDWSPDGHRIAYSDSDQIFVMDECGGSRSQLTQSTTDPATYGIDPAWSPDGTKIAHWSGSIPNPSIAVMNADGSGRQVLASNADFLGISWQPLVETLPSPVSRSHNCVSAVPALTPAPNPAPLPVTSPATTAIPADLPGTGGAPARQDLGLYLLGAFAASLAVLAGYFGIRRFRRS